MEQICPFMVPPRSHTAPSPQMRQIMVCDFANSIGCPNLITPNDIEDVLLLIFSKSFFGAFYSQILLGK